MAHFPHQLLKILTDLIKRMHQATEKVFSGRHMGLQKGTGAVKGGKLFSSRQGKLEKGFVPCTAANPSGQKEKQPQTAALTEVSRATCLHASLPLLILAGVTHMLNLRLCYTRTAPSPPRTGREVNKSQSWPSGLGTSLSGQKVRSRSSLLYFPAF